MFAFRSRAGSAGRPSPAGRTPVLWLIGLLALALLAACSDSDSNPPSQEPMVDAQWVGFRDGDGDWQQIDLPESQVFDFTTADTGTEVTDPQGRYSLAVVRAYAARREVYLFTVQTTLAESPEFDFRKYFPDAEQSNLEITVSGLPGATSVSLYLAGDRRIPYNGVVTFDTDPGTYDLIAVASSSGTPAQLIALYDQTYDPGLTPITINWASGAPVVLTGPYTVTLLPEQQGSMEHGEVSLLTGNGTIVDLSGASAEDSFTYKALPPENMVPDDVYMLDLFFRPDSDTVISYFAGFGTAEDLSVPPMGSFDGVYAADTSTGTLLPGLAASKTTDAIAYTTLYTGRGNDIEYSAISLTTSGWIGAAEQITIAMPDMHTAPGWSTNWSIPVNAVASYTAATVQTASTGTSLQDFADWYFSDAPHVSADQWFESIANFSESAETLNN